MYSKAESTQSGAKKKQHRNMHCVLSVLMCKSVRNMHELIFEKHDKMEEKQI